MLAKLPTPRRLRFPPVCPSGPHQVARRLAAPSSGHTLEALRPSSGLAPRLAFVLVSLVVLGTGFFATGASAQPKANRAPGEPPRAAALLEPGGDAAQSPKLRRETIRIVATVLARLGYDVLTPELVEKDLTVAGFGNCTEPACAPIVFAQLGPELVVVTRIWNKDDQPFEVAAHVTRLAPGSPKPKTGRAVVPITAGVKLEGALQAALAEALRDADKALVRLHLRGSPQGATVVLDGEPRGTLPLDLDVRAGSHTFVVSAGGFHEHHETLNLQASPTPVTVEVALERDRGETADFTPPNALASHHEASTFELADRPEKRASPWNYVIGGGFAAAGVALLVSPLMTLAQRGECVGGAEAGRCDVATFTTGQKVLTGLSVLSLGASAVFFIVRPLKLRIDSSPSGIAFTAQAHF